MYVPVGLAHGSTGSACLSSSPLLQPASRRNSTYSEFFNLNFLSMPFFTIDTTASAKIGSEERLMDFRGFADVRYCRF